MSFWLDSVTTRGSQSPPTEKRRTEDERMTRGSILQAFMRNKKCINCWGKVCFVLVAVVNTPPLRDNYSFMNFKSQ